MKNCKKSSQGTIVVIISDQRVGSLGSCKTREKKVLDRSKITPNICVVFWDLLGISDVIWHYHQNLITYDRGK